MKEEEKTNLKKINIFVLMMLLFSLTGCAKCISTETSIVQVKVVDKYYRVEHRTPVYNGKTIMWVNSPAVYSITVEYEDNQYTVSGGATYNKYSNRIGEYVNGTLQIRKYDNGSVKCKIVGLE